MDGRAIVRSVVRLAGLIVVARLVGQADRVVSVVRVLIAAPLLLWFRERLEPGQTDQARRGLWIEFGAHRASYRSAY